VKRSATSGAEVSVSDTGTTVTVAEDETRIGERGSSVADPGAENKSPGKSFQPVRPIKVAPTTINNATKTNIIFEDMPKADRTAWIPDGMGFIPLSS